VSAVTDGRHDYRILHVGACGWPGCPWGDYCALVLRDGSSLTENRDSRTLAPREEP
jgi:hypothetical protein